MFLVTVRRLDDNDIGSTRAVWRQQDGVGQPPEVTTERDPETSVGEVEIDRCRTEDVTGTAPRGVHSWHDRHAVTEGDRLQLPQALSGVGLGVQRQGGPVLREPAAVGVLRLFFVEVPTVGKDHGCQLVCARGAPDRTAETHPDEPRQEATMVDVSVGEQHGVDRGRVDRELVPVREAEFFATLEESAVDQDPTAGRVEQGLAPRHGPGPADEGQHWRLNARHEHLRCQASAAAGATSIMVTTNRPRPPPKVPLVSAARRSADRSTSCWHPCP